MPPDNIPPQAEKPNGLQQWLALGWPWLVMTLAWLIYWLPVVLGQNQLYMRDLTFYALPMKTFMLSRMLEGAFPLWFPHVSNGMPFFAEPSHQVLYPFNLLFFITPTAVHGISWFVILHLLLAQFAFYWLCRVMGFSRALSTWGGLLFGFSGYTLSISDNVNYLPAVTWAPLGLAWFIQGLKSANLRFSILTALAVALMVLAGDSFNPMFLGLFCALLIVCRWKIPALAAWLPGAGPKFAWVHLCIAFGLGGLLTAVQTLPTAELLALSVRQAPLHYDEITLWSFPPHRLIEFIQPYFYGSKYPSPHFIGQFMYPQFREPWTDSLYIGLIPVGLAVLACFLSFKRALFWLLLTLMALLVSFAHYAPFDFRLLLKLFPPLNYHRYLEKLVFWATLGLDVLAVYGADLFFRYRHTLIAHFQAKHHWAKVLWTLGFLVFGTVIFLKIPTDLWIWPHAMENSREWHGHFYYREPHVQGLYQHWWAILLPVLLLPWLKGRWQARYMVLLMGLAILDLMLIHAGKVPVAPTELLISRPTPATYRIIQSDGPKEPIRILFDDNADYVDEQDEPVILKRIADAYGVGRIQDNFPYYWIYRFLYSQNRLLFNYGILYDLRYQNGRFEPLQQKRHKWMDQVLIKNRPDLLVALSNVQYIVTSYDPPNSQWDHYQEHITEVGTAPKFNLRILKVNNAVPRAYLAPSAIYNPEPEKIFKIVTQDFTAYDYQRQVEVAASKPNRPKGTPPLPLDPKARVRILRDEPEHVEIEVKSPYTGPDTHLVLTESLFPGWQATLDGKPTEIYLANQRFMAVSIPPGTHRLVLRYHSTWFWPGLLLSLLGGLMALGVFLLPQHRVTFRGASR